MGKPPGSLGYRFDPAQTSDRSDAASAPSAPPRTRPTLKAELIYAPRTARTQRPHVFERPRLSDKQRILQRRGSTVLPKSNPFAIPHCSLLDSITPAIRFLTLVALFTAAGTWLQIVKLRGAAKNEIAQPPATTAQEPAAPAAKTADRQSTSPSAAGPVKKSPESNTRVGRARAVPDFARLRGDIIPVTPAAELLGPTLPDLANADGSTLPRARMTEPAPNGTANAVAPTDGAPELARTPEFNTENAAR
jgi:hypothetical protein